jgi:predicted nucleic-acid-binding Zn-ribbon protein
MSCDYLDDSTTHTDGETTISQAGDCPKCGGEMIVGMTTNYIRILKQGDLTGDLVSAFYCRECGFVEFYKKPSSKEPWRWRKHLEEQSKKSEQTPKEEGPSTETSTRRMVR